MRVQKRIPWLMSLGVVLAAMALWGTRAGADVTSDRPGSVVIWPKVIADGTRDTIISLTNTSNSQAYAHCEYIQGSGRCSNSNNFCSLPDGSDCPVIPGIDNECIITWQTGDFDVVLTRQQPTIWRVSTGRVENLLMGQGIQCVDFFEAGPNGPVLRQSCPGLFLIGNVPPAPNQPDDPTVFTGGFRGELRCFQVAMDGSLFGGNALKGEATIETLGSNQISEYNSVNVLSDQGPGLVDGLVELNGVNYNACPGAVDLSHYAPRRPTSPVSAAGASDLVAAELGAPCATSGCGVRTEFTLVPCRADFVAEEAASVSAAFQVWDEFESFFSREQDFDCWASLSLDTLGFTNVNGATFQHSRVTSSGTICVAGTNVGLRGCGSDAACGLGGVCGPASGILAVLEEFHQNDNSNLATLAGLGTAAANAHLAEVNGSLERRGRCRGTLTLCTTDAQCPATGLCRKASTTPCTTDAQCTTAGDFCDHCINDEMQIDTVPIVIP